MLTNSGAHSNLSLPSLQVPGQSSYHISPYTHPPTIYPAPSHPRARTPVRTPRGNHRSDATDDEDDDSDPGTDAGPVAGTSDWTAAFLHRLGSFQRRARRAEWVDDLRTGRGVRAVVGVLDRGRRWGSRLFVVQLRARTDRDGDGGKRTGRTSGGSKGEGMSGRGITIVVLLLLLGLRELFLAPSPRTLRPKVHGRQPFDVLAELAPDQSHALSGQSKLWFHEMGTTEDQYAGERGDTTAIVLHWKRTENVVLEVAHLCRYSFFRHVVVWNNNPDVFLTKEVGPIVSLISCASLTRLICSTLRHPAVPSPSFGSTTHRPTSFSYPDSSPVRPPRPPTATSRTTTGTSHLSERSIRSSSGIQGEL